MKGGREVSEKDVVERREREVEPGPDSKTPPSPCWLLYMPCACSQMDDVVIEEKKGERSVGACACQPSEQRQMDRQKDGAS